MAKTPLKEAIQREAHRLFDTDDLDAPRCLETEPAPEPEEVAPPTTGEEGVPPTAGEEQLDGCSDGVCPSMEDFTGLAGADLVRAAYRTVLGREPDEAGFRYYLSGLVSGRFTTVDLLGFLRYSPEGRERAVPVSGLFVPFFLSRLARLPVLGAFVRPWALWTAHRLQEAGIHAAHEKMMHRLENLARHIHASLAHTETQIAASQAEMAALQTRLAAVSDEVAALQTQLGAFTDDVAALQTQLSGVTHDVAALRQDLPGGLQPFLEHQAGAVQDRLRRLDDNFRQVQAATQSLRRAILLLDRRTAPSPSSETPEALSDVGYLLFEDAFRGSDADLTSALAVYLPLLRSAPIAADRPVLDLGCGRGVWLALLRDHGYPARGVDLNDAAAQAARTDGLDVTVADAESFLDAAQAESFGAVTAFHLLEHLAPDRWLSFLSRIHRVLAPGGLAIVETPNPRHLLVASGDFHRDPTHVKPVFPDTLAFLGEAAGFWESTAWFFNEDRSRLIRAAAVAFDSLNEYLTVSRDFAWTGRKRP